jgi:carbon monoxide dehydrogenase subunit G
VQLEHSFTVPAAIDDAWKVLLDIERVAPCMPGAALETVHGDDFTGTVKVKLGPIGLTYKGKASFVEKDEATHRAVIKAQGRDSRGNGTASATVTATLTEEGNSTKVEVTTDLDITGKPAQFGRGVMLDVGNKLIGQFADCLAGKLGGGPDEPVATSSPALAAAVPATDESANGSAAAATPGPSEPASTAETTSAPAPGTPTPTTPTPTASTPSESIPTESTPTASTPSAGPRIVAPQDVKPIDLLGHAGPAFAKRLAPVLGGIIVLLVVVRLRRRCS